MEKNTSAENKALKVLILEDTLQDLELMVAQLSEAGYQLDVTHTEEESGFREALKGKKYDIILSDFMLPRFDAFGALEICQEICPEVPFICVSGSIGEETAIDLLKKGADDYVLKDRPARLPYAVQHALEKVKEKAALHKAAQELKESENRFRQVAESAQEWIWEVDTNGLYTYASPVIELLLGYTPDELVGKKYFYDFFIPEKREELKTAAFEVFAKRENFNDFENINLGKNGQLVIALTNGSPVVVDAGNFKGYRGVTENITERKQAEKNIKQNQFYLTKAQELGRIGTWEIDLIKNELFWTEQNYINFGVPLGTPLTYETFLECIHPDDKEYVNAEFMAAINGKPYDIEHRLIVGSEVRWVREKADIEFDDSKKAIKAIGFTQDITERKWIEQKIIAAKEKAEESERLKNEILEKYHSTQKAANIGNWDWNMFTNAIWWSEGTYDIFEVSQDEFIPDFNNNTIFLLPDEIEIYYQVFKNCIENGVLLNHDFTVKTATGKIKICNNQGKVEYNEKNEPIRFIGTLLDITARKQAEKALLAKVDELERFHKLTVGREITMVELKKEVNNLLNKLGQDNKYMIVE